MDGVTACEEVWVSDCDGLVDPLALQDWEGDSLLVPDPVALRVADWLGVSESDGVCENVPELRCELVAEDVHVGVGA